jgi:signal peptidase I
MEPVIMPGEAVLVRPYAPASGRLPGIREGDVISYRSLRSDDVIITHRIVSINQQAGTVTTKGDALTVADPPITPDRIVGVAVQHVQFTGFILDFMRQPGGLAAMVYAPALIICSSEIRRLVRHYHTSHYRLYAYPW